jgi:hypothetical protein
MNTESSPANASTKNKIMYFISRGNFKIRSNSKWASQVFFAKCIAKLSQNFRGIESDDNRMSFYSIVNEHST